MRNQRFENRSSFGTIDFLLILVVLSAAIVAMIYANYRFSGVYNGNYQAPEQQVHTQLANSKVSDRNDSDASRFTEQPRIIESSAN